MSKPSKDAVREKLRAFLQKGNSEDVASVLVHTLMRRAEMVAEVEQIVSKPSTKKAARKNTKHKPK